MKNNLKLSIAIALLSQAPLISANTVLTLGHQDFADGSFVSVGNFQSAKQADNPLQAAPFDGKYIGGDVPGGSNFSASWTFNFTPVNLITSANLELGIYDHDSQAPGNQVASFTLNGVDLTSNLNTLFEAHGGANSEVNDYTLALTPLAIYALSSGHATFALSLTGPGLGLEGSLPFNGAALDFSTLTISNQAVAQHVPEPEPSALFLIGISTCSWLNVKEPRSFDS